MPVLPGHAPHGADREGDDIHNATNKPSGDEGDVSAVGRKHRAAVWGGIRHKEPGLTTSDWHGPDVSARTEGDLAAIGRDARFGERECGGPGISRTRGRLRAGGSDRSGGREGTKDDDGNGNTHGTDSL